MKAPNQFASRLQSFLNPNKSGKANGQSYQSNKKATHTTYHMSSQDYYLTYANGKAYIMSSRDNKIFNLNKQGMPKATITKTRTGQDVSYSRPQLSAQEFQAILDNKPKYLQLRGVYNFVDVLVDKDPIQLDQVNAQVIW